MVASKRSLIMKNFLKGNCKYLVFAIIITFSSNLLFAAESSKKENFLVVDFFFPIPFSTNRLEINTSQIGEVAYNAAIKKINDFDQDKSLFENITSNLGNDVISTSKTSMKLGFSVYHLYDSKSCCNHEDCKKHKPKRKVFGGGMGLSANTFDYNADIYFGRSYVNNGMFKILVLGIVGFNICGNLQNSIYFGPEAGIEIDFVLQPFEKLNPRDFYLMFGCRALVGYNFAAQNDGYPMFLTAALKPKVSAGFSF